MRAVSVDGSEGSDESTPSPDILELPRHYVLKPASHYVLEPAAHYMFEPATHYVLEPAAHYVFRADLVLCFGTPYTLIYVCLHVYAPIASKVCFYKGLLFQ